MQNVKRLRRNALFTARFDGHKSSLAGARNVDVRRVAVAAGEQLKRAKKALGPTRAGGRLRGFSILTLAALPVPLHGFSSTRTGSRFGRSSMASNIRVLHVLKH